MPSGFGVGVSQPISAPRPPATGRCEFFPAIAIGPTIQFEAADDAEE